MPGFVPAVTLGMADMATAPPDLLAELLGGAVMGALEAPMLTVGKDAADVERRLKDRELICPGCGGRLAGWGYARVRWVLARGRVGYQVRPRRARCEGCATTHVLLPVSVLVRRPDEAGVIGAALVAAASGWGGRRIGRWLSVPFTTVRGWVRRLAGRADGVRRVFTSVQTAVAVDAAPIAVGCSPLADALAAISAAAAAIAARWPGLVPEVSAWEAAVAVTGGSLLAPVLRPVGINTNALLPIFALPA